MRSLLQQLPQLVAILTCRPPRRVVPRLGRATVPCHRLGQGIDKLPADGAPVGLDAEYTGAARAHAHMPTRQDCCILRLRHADHTLRAPANVILVRRRILSISSIPFG
eukprot:scaffold12448_cov123-Isochrysis_galbana.AAC.4